MDKMKILLLFQLWLLRWISALSVSSQLPSFTWLDGTEPLLKIRFPDGGHDVIRFHETERLQGVDDDCIMTGEFEQEPDVSVTLTGGCVNSKDFELTIVGSERLQHVTFNITNGKAKPTGHPLSRGFFAFNDVVEYPNTSFRKQQLKPTVGDSILPHHVWLPIELYADVDFKKAFGDDENVQRVMNRIVGHAQTWFSHKNLKPEIILEPSFTDGWKYPKRMSMDLDSELDIVSDYVDKLRNTNTPHGQPHYSVQNRVSVFFGIQNFFQIFSGVSYTGPVCDEFRGNRVSLIVEHWRYISRSGETLAHEIAHSLGIGHDFSDTTNRYLRDKRGKLCFTKGSLMDYKPKRTKWSKCSIESLQTRISNSLLSCLKMSSNAS